ncbi:MAG: sulfatase-like hydrolase/transferase [Ginsengibacter sp.]
MALTKNNFRIRTAFCIIACFIIALVFIRARVLGYSYYFPFQKLKYAKKLLLLSYPDVIYAAGLGVFFICLLYFSRRYKRLSSVVFWLFVPCIIVSLLWALVNVEALNVLNTPINYQLLYYADLLESNYVLNSVNSSVYLMLLKQFIIFTASVFILAWLFSYLLSKVHLSAKWLYVLAGITGLIFFAYGYSAQKYVQVTKEHDYNQYVRVLNPVTTFFHSVFLSIGKEEELFKKFSIESGGGFNLLNRETKHSSSSGAPKNLQVNNVVIFVMESVRALYMSGYSTIGDSVTPQIKKHLPEAVLFKNIYASSPNSGNSLFSILSSMYPLISFKYVTVDHPALPAATLSAELKKLNYRTAFYSSADNTYGRANEYLSHRGFDVIADYRNIPCDKGTINSGAEGVGNGTNDMCMVNAFKNWIAEEPAKPFFSILWTLQTHWPYFAFGPEKSYVKNNAYLNRYLNALHEGDEALGNLLDNLKKRGLAESTLVVVVGDHGEAFGEHNQFGHGSNIYEENIHVPLILINPLLFSGEEKTVIGGHLDIAPTTLDILQQTAPSEWQGSSLFDSTRLNKNYFFSTWSDYMFGYRKNNLKVIFNAYQNKTMVFNLKDDPQELKDISADMPAIVDSAHHELAQWVQYQRTLMDKRIKAFKRVSTN